MLCLGCCGSLPYAAAAGAADALRWSVLSVGSRHNQERLQPPTLETVPPLPPLAAWCAFPPTNGLCLWSAAPETAVKNDNEQGHVGALLTLPAVGYLFLRLQAEAAQFPWLRLSPHYATQLAMVECTLRRIRQLAQGITEGLVKPVALDLLARRAALVDSIGAFHAGFDASVVKRWSASMATKRTAWQMLLEAYRDHMPLHPRHVIFHA
jgi:hypothetical protein